MTTWLQKPNYDAEDIETFADYSAFESYFDSLDMARLDSETRELIRSKEEWCPWGIGINMDSPSSIHIFREDVDKNTFCVTHLESKKVKLFGLIPQTKTKDTTEEGLSLSAVKSLASSYFKNLG